VYAFGSNRDGQMGFDLLMSSVIMVPQLVRSLESLFITAVSAGDHHSLFLSNQGRVYSCGWSRYGVLGYTIDGQQALPKMIDALASVKIVGISAGTRPWRRHRVAIVRASADVTKHLTRVVQASFTAWRSARRVGCIRSGVGTTASWASGSTTGASRSPTK
jgi:alpha-tubulin suppressor-like RCC1 family protein